MQTTQVTIDRMARSVAEEILAHHIVAAAHKIAPKDERIQEALIRAMDDLMEGKPVAPPVKPSLLAICRPLLAAFTLSVSGGVCVGYALGKLSNASKATSPATPQEANQPAFQSGLASGQSEPSATPYPEGGDSTRGLPKGTEATPEGTGSATTPAPARSFSPKSGGPFSTPHPGPRPL